MTLQILRIVHVLLFVCNTLAYYEFDENSRNVGTVLFSPSDVDKQKWSQQKIAILRTRKYFQQLIPPAHFLRTVNDHFVDELHKYFKDTYINIKRDATDPESDKIMMIALSDTIGGYLKEWVLPITKYAFYGGTVSQENVVKILNFYNDIKNYLGTDGNGWHQQNQHLLTSSSINVAPPKHFTERGMQNPCEKLSYFEQTPSGLSVPIPYVNWNEELSTMFVPLKNLSLITLNLPSSIVNPLTKYYDVAKRCTETMNVKDEKGFDDKFHVWLCNDIIPHLKDDNVYLGLGNVLSLVDSFKEACLHFDDIAEVKPPFCGVKLISKKMIIFISLLLIEAAWCILAFFFILRKKIKNNKSNRSSKGNNTTLLGTLSRWTNTAIIRTNNQTSYTKSIIGTTSKWTNTSGKVSNASSSVSGFPTPKTGIKLSNKQQLRNVALATNVSMIMTQNSIGTGSQIHCSSKMCSTSVVNIINESPSTHTKSCSKKIHSQDKLKIPSQDECPCEFIPDCAKYCYSKSVITKHEKNKHKKTTVVQGTKKAKTVIKEVYKGKHGPKIIGNANKDTSKCLDCIKPDPITELVPVVKNQKLQIRQTADTSKATKLCFQRDVFCKGGKIKPDKPYVQVTIDRPRKEIIVSHSINIKSVELSKPVKPSRIPKLAPINPNSRRKPPTPSPRNLSSGNNRRSLIPLFNKRAIDDLDIQKVNVPKNDKLNVTM